MYNLSDNYWVVVYVHIYSYGSGIGRIVNVCMCTGERVQHSSCLPSALVCAMPQ